MSIVAPQQEHGFRKPGFDGGCHGSLGQKISLRILAGERANEMRSALACVVQGIERSNLVGGFASSRRRLPAQDRFARGANFIQAANARRVRSEEHTSE